MSFLALGVVFALVFLLMVKILINDQTEDRNVAEIRDFGYSIQRELILAAEVNPGYERQMMIPDKVGLIDYAINNTESLLIINYDNSDYTFPIPNISGTVTKGLRTIKNVGGQVQIE